ncbi:MAG: hypothetical protein SVX38_00555 [Chloroflexota bacterium]|nr:hypothetical protein [Chloroflexota bacterium]
MRIHKTLSRLLLIVLFISATTSYAAPPAQDGAAIITSPQDNAIIRGVVSITGTATHPSFWRYDLFYAPDPNPTGDWIFIEVHENMVNSGPLGTWDTTLVPDGVYQLRLRVIRSDSNYVEYIVHQISIANRQPTETPTPEATPTALSTPTPPPPTPTVVIEQPPTATPRPTSTPYSVGTPRPTPAFDDDSLIGISTGGLGRSFCYGAGLAVGIFVLLGILVMLRSIIARLARRIWRWARSSPRR